MCNYFLVVDFDAVCFDYIKKRLAFFLIGNHYHLHQV